jgi:hypothetical protein
VWYAALSAALQTHLPQASLFPVGKGIRGAVTAMHKCHPMLEGRVVLRDGQAFGKFSNVSTDLALSHIGLSALIGGQMGGVYIVSQKALFSFPA